MMDSDDFPGKVKSMFGEGCGDSVAKVAVAANLSVHICRLQRMNLAGEEGTANGMIRRTEKAHWVSRIDRTGSPLRLCLCLSTWAPRKPLLPLINTTRLTTTCAPIQLLNVPLLPALSLCTLPRPFGASKDFL